MRAIPTSKDSIVFTALLSLLALGAVGCAEGSTYERAALERDQARLSVAQRDQWIRTLQWQLGYQAQQDQVRQQRDEAMLRELWAQAQALVTENAALAERVKKGEAERLASAAAEDQGAREAGAKGRAKEVCTPLRAEDLRRIQAAIDARNVPLSEELARIEKLLRERGGADPRPGARSVSPSLGDVVDPWGGRR